MAGFEADGAGNVEVDADMEEITLMLVLVLEVPLPKVPVLVRLWATIWTCGTPLLRRHS